MKDDLFETLPQEIVTEIMRRLMIRSIMRCKYVCKSWRYLIKGVEFATLYTPEQCLAFALPDHQYIVCDETYKPLLRFLLPSPNSRCLNKPCIECSVIDSVNGLLLLWDECANNIFVCNPMTCEYAVLPPPTILERWHGAVFGFGVSKRTGKYKILCGTCDRLSCCLCVYTLGRRGGSWRSIAALDDSIRHSLVDRLQVAPFFNGNLHWLSFDLGENLSMCYFDIETEVFTSFSLDLPDILQFSQLRIFENRQSLYLCATTDNCHIVMWRMNTYGVTNSWIKEYTINNLPHGRGFVYPLKVLANGDLLFAVDLSNEQYIFSKNTEETIVTDSLLGYTMYSCNISLYTPNFLSLTTLGIDNVERLKVEIFLDSCDSTS